MGAHRRARRKANYGPFLLAGLVLLLATAVSIIWLQSGTREKEPEPSPTPAYTPVPTAIPPDMFEWKPGEYVHVEYGEGTSNVIDDSIFATPDKKTAADLVAWAKMTWDNQWGYVWGTFGTVMDEQLLAYKIQQYGSDITDYEDVIRAKWMDRRTVDCAGLIKSYCWYDPYRQQISYDSGDMPDIGTDGFYDNATKKGPIDTIPETPGLLVYVKGHIGVYVGDGWAVEAISHEGGVVKTRVEDRPWTDWLECPYIQY